MGILAGLLGSAACAPGTQPAASTVALRVGDLAPDLAVQASDGKVVRLSDFRGQRAVVVAWFPKAFTGG